ncbi:hypothetical protein [Spirillospora sp. CA-128828]|uniref:hypothetical protein n=1 Tax=Spirillospora sp. CA-128828 TaxID=3240033 RepID=UPI003D944875
MAPAAVLLALCAGCSSSSSGQILCAPCPSPATVSVTGVDRLIGDGRHMRVCVGDQPCTDLRVPPSDATTAPPSCGTLSCSLNGSGTLQITLNERDAHSLAEQPVRVTASKKGGRDVLRGSGTMRFTDDKGPCACDHAHADVALG